MNNNRENLLCDYASFLESTLINNGYEFENSEIMEITDDRFNVVSEYLRFKEDNPKIKCLSYRIVTEDILNEYLLNPMDFPKVNIVFSQMPFRKPNELIKKLSLVPILTPAVAVFGAYGLKSQKYYQSINLEGLEKFAKQLNANEIDYDCFYSQTDNKYFELIISRNEQLHR